MIRASLLSNFLTIIVISAIGTNGQSKLPWRSVREIELGGYDKLRTVNCRRSRSREREEQICDNSLLAGFSLRDQSYPNHGLVTREDVGETDTRDFDPDNGLHCIGFDGCCVSSAPADQRGQFVFPGGTSYVPIESNIGTTGYYRTRGDDRIFLHRRGGTIQGIFQCLIRSESSQTMHDTFYIGVYDADSGQ